MLKPGLDGSCWRAGVAIVLLGAIWNNYRLNATASSGEMSKTIPGWLGSSVGKSLGCAVSPYDPQSPICPR